VQILKDEDERPALGERLEQPAPGRERLNPVVTREVVGGEKADERSSRLSGGQLRRLDFALALIGVPGCTTVLLVLVPLGRLARPIVTGVYGALFWIGAVLTGLLAPVALDLMRRGDLEQRLRLRAALILVGGLVLRFVIVMAPQWPQVPPWHL